MSLTRCLFALFSLALFGLSLLLAATPREADWKAVQAAIERGLPKTAIERLEPMIEKAMSEKAYAEAVKAIATKISLEGNIQGNKPEEKITRMRAEIDKAPAEMKPALHAILANWYWHYFQQNRWRFMQRTQTAAPPGDDFTTWDLTRILDQIDRQFQSALADAATLKSIPVADYDILLVKGSAPDAFRPTLYDVLVHNALEFYSAGEQAASNPQDAFDLSASGPIFGSTDEFLRWEPGSGDTGSPLLKAVRLYQELLRFHLEDDDPSARLDADLLRLNFGHNHARGQEKDERYKAALRRMADQNMDHAISARALHHLAEVIHTEGDWVEAHSIASEGLNRFRDSVGGRRCYNLIQQIEAPSSAITTERVWNDSRPTIDVHYRNVSKVFFRLVPFDFDGFVRSGRWQPEELSGDQKRNLLARPPVRQWSVDLPATDDYRERTEPIESPEDLALGSYFLIASHNESFSDRENHVSFTEVWVSRLAVVTRNHGGRGKMDGFVLDAKSGEPMPGARVRVWERNPQNVFQLRPTVTTDSNGLFRVSQSQRRQLLLLATRRGDALSSANFLRPYIRQEPKRRETTKFFTDRAIYRPGQTIHYKGICISYDTKSDNYATISGRDVSLVFRDVNGKEIERYEHRSNDHGSFSGSVTAPRDRLMGRMTLQVAGGPGGSTQIRVEEYKRPKFRVELESPEKAARLNGTVELKGKATAYTGASIDGARVRWRVVRQVQYPSWWYWRCWWMPPRRQASQEIAHGNATTAADGSFDIEFTAEPDQSAPIESEPTFSYSVHADVTDTSGETRTAHSTVRVGYTALSATMSAAEWLTDDQETRIEIRTATLDGEGQPAGGTIKVYEVRQPNEVTRSGLPGRRPVSRRPAQDRRPDPTNPNSWPLGESVFEQPFEADAGGSAVVTIKLSAGLYRAKLETKDRFGKPVTADLPLRVLNPDAETFSLKLPNLFASPTDAVEPDNDYFAVWGSGYESARAYVEVEHRGRMLQSYWTGPGVTQSAIRQRVNEAMRGGFTVRTTMVRENRAYIENRQVRVPWSNKQLKIRWEHMTSKLEPAAKETWMAIIEGADSETVRDVEMVAAMYDASLDAFRRHSWPTGFQVFRREGGVVQSVFENQLKGLQTLYHSWHRESRDGSLTYRSFPPSIIRNMHGQAFRRGRGFAAGAPLAVAENGVDRMSLSKDEGAMADAVRPARKRVDGEVEPKADLDTVPPRRNLEETAFFFPHLAADDNGVVRIEFTMPETLTQWRFLGFAHDRQLRSGPLTSTAVTAKELMVQPMPPRFLREGDEVEFTVKISNQSPTQQQGTARLALSDARTGTSVDSALGNTRLDQPFDLPAGESVSLAWRLKVPDGVGFLTYRAVASTGRLSDGEEGYLPVLSRRILLTESLTLPVRGEQAKEYELAKLSASGDSDSLVHQSLTVQMVSNPSWYAVMALPYLMEYPHQCAEQTFNRVYANALARRIVMSDPKIRAVFEQWRATPALDSPLERNEDLKSVLIEETPWYRQASDESQARRNVGILFQENRIGDELARATHQLAQMQLDDGAWPWFPGGGANDYITLYITTGFGRLRHLGADIDMAPALRSLKRLDGWARRQYENIKRNRRDENHLSSAIALYLYGRSFFLKDRPVDDQDAAAVNFWIQQAKEHWLDLPIRQSQAHLAIALNRFGEAGAANEIIDSIKERAVRDEEQGMFWRDTELSWWWYRAPIETQAMMIEALDEVGHDKQAVEDCKVWLLKQKQTRDWKTTKATADAVYALLLRGSDLLASDALVHVELGGQAIEPKDVQAGTGFFEQRFVRDQVRPRLGRVRVKKTDDGVAWGSLHWQYLEEIGKVTPHEGTPLVLTKELYVKRNTAKGPMLVRVEGPVEVGDELVVRLVLRVDRDMEYVHIKDHRGSGTEPVNVLSQYKFQDGLAYYESTRDTASHFFIDYLPKGTYVFEYSTRVQLRGQYETGVASIQCMYAPEFNGHSQSVPLVVR